MNRSDISYIKFSQLKGIGLKNKVKLLSFYESADSVFEEAMKSSTDSRLYKVKKSLIAFNEKQFEESIFRLKSVDNVRVISINNSLYPKLLKEIPDPPIVLYALGNIDLLGKSKVSIVGSRHASGYGKDVAQKISYQVSEDNMCVVSGMASGIDACAHVGALKSIKTVGHGGTIAVLGSGLDVCYQKSNHRLYNQIREKGLLISEYLPNVQPNKYHFPQRNRIISGLSLGVLVVEASVNSGSLITAKLSLDYNREVFAIPGAIQSLHSKGCHYLIKNGAKLVENKQDIYDEIGHVTKNECRIDSSDVKDSMEKKYKDTLTKLQGSVLNCIQFHQTTFEKIMQDSRLSMAELNVVLLQLEILGLINNEKSGSFRRIK